jgi:hypothetical protein
VSKQAHELFEIARRLRLSITTLGVLCGVAPLTIRHVEMTGRMPARRIQREAIERFITRSRNAQRRSELRLEDEVES